MPAARKHLAAVQGQAHPRTDLVAQDGGEQKLRASGGGTLTDHGHQGRKHERVGVQWCGRKVVVELEALNEAAVEHGCRRRARGLVPAGDHAGTGVVQCRHGLHCDSRPRQLCANQEAPDSVEEQVASTVGDFSRDVSQRSLGEPRRQLARGPGWISGPDGVDGFGGAVEGRLGHDALLADSVSFESGIGSGCDPATGVFSSSQAW